MLQMERNWGEGRDEMLEQSVLPPLHLPLAPARGERMAEIH